MRVREGGPIEVHRTQLSPGTSRVRSFQSDPPHVRAECGHNARPGGSREGPTPRRVATPEPEALLAASARADFQLVLNSTGPFERGGRALARMNPSSPVPRRITLAGSGTGAVTAVKVDVFPATDVVRTKFPKVVGNKAPGLNTTGPEIGPMELRRL